MVSRWFKNQHASGEPNYQPCRQLFTCCFGMCKLTAIGIRKVVLMKYPSELIHNITLLCGVQSFVIQNRCVAYPKKRRLPKKPETRSQPTKSPGGIPSQVAKHQVLAADAVLIPVKPNALLILVAPGRANIASIHSISSSSQVIT